MGGWGADTPSSGKRWPSPLPAFLVCCSASLLSVESKTERFFFLILFVIFIICIFSHFLSFHLIPFVSYLCVYFNEMDGAALSSANEEDGAPSRSPNPAAFSAKQAGRRGFLMGSVLLGTVCASGHQRGCS